MTEKQPYPVLPEHMVAFGMIVQWYARHESLLQTIMAHLAATRLANVMFMMAGLNTSAKFDLVSAFVNESDLDGDQKTRIREFIDKVNSYRSLRNDIAHSVWIEGNRPNAIKPMSVKVRGGKAKVLGLKRNEVDYTPEELKKIADTMNELYAQFRDYLKDQKIFEPKQ